MIFEVRKNFIAESNDRRTEKVSSVGIESIYVAVVEKKKKKKKKKQMQGEVKMLVMCLAGVLAPSTSLHITMYIESCSWILFYIHVLRW